MNRLKKQSSDDILSRIMDQLQDFARNSETADNYSDRLDDMLRDEINRVNDSQGLSNLSDSIDTAFDAVSNLESSMVIIKYVLEQKRATIDNKRF